jgi:DNA-binding MarR family transcriptional regulator
MTKRSNEALVALRRILRVTDLNSRKLAQHSDVNTSQLLVMQLLAREGETLPSVIAKSVELKQATVTLLLNKLEDAGLVTRRRDTEDRRRIWVGLTDTGRSVLERSPDLLQDRFRNAFEHLEDWEQSMLVTALERVAALLDADNLEAAPILEIGDLDRLVKD